MRTTIFYATMCLVVMGLTPAKKLLTLKEAVDAGLVQAEIVSAGGHSGKCISLKLKNLRSRDCEILLPAGTIFISEDEGMQDIFTTEDLMVSLSGDQKKNVKAAGFCSQYNDRSPAEGTGFSIGETKNKNLLELAKFTNGKKLEEDLLQSAVWCLSDDKPISGVYGSGEEAKSLRALLCSLTGKPDTWYHTNSLTSVDPEGYIRQEPVLVSGRVTFTAVNPGLISAEIKSGDGDFEYKVQPDMEVPKAGKYDYDFNLRVKGWKKGKYIVFIHNDEEKILMQEFEI